MVELDSIIGNYIEIREKLSICYNRNKNNYKEIILFNDKKLILPFLLYSRTKPEHQTCMETENSRSN
jgi:hypothetical protein